MKSIDKIDSQAWIFITKCVIGVAICYYFYVRWPAYPFEWAIISVGLGLSFDNTNQAAIDRTVANIGGCFAGIILYLLPLSALLQLSIGIILIVIAGFKFNRVYMVRTAITAFVIVMLQNKAPYQWSVPIERALTTLFGCLVAFLLTLLFNLFIPKAPASPGAEE